jgi:hypothetical protein
MTFVFQFMLMLVSLYGLKTRPAGAVPPASGVEPLEEPPLDEPLEEPLDDPLDDPLEEPLDPPEDDPLEDAPPELPLLEPPLLLPPLEPPLLEPLLPPPGGVSGVEVVAGPPEHPVIATKATAIGASGGVGAA